MTWVAPSGSWRNTGPRFWRLGSTALSLEIPFSTSMFCSPLPTSYKSMASPLWSGCSPHSSTGENRALALLELFCACFWVPGAGLLCLTLSLTLSVFAAFLGLPCVHLAWMTLKKYSEDGLKNRKPQILCGQQSPKTKYQSQGKKKKKKKKQTVIFVFNKTLWSLEASILREQGERPTSRAREGSPVGGRGTADPASLQNPTGVNVESLLSAGREPYASGFAHSPFFLGLFFQNGHLPLDTVCEGKKHTVFLSGLAVVQSMALPKLIKPPSISPTRPWRSSNPTRWWTLPSHP